MSTSDHLPARLPWAGLLALFAAAFLAVTTELLPAGLLLQLSEGLNASEGQIGFLVTGYAVASCLTAIPVTAALRRAGKPYELSPGALLRATLVTSGTMTNRIDRLAQAGLVRRRPDPEDRRGVLVTLTETGLTRVDSAFSDLLRREHDLLSGLTSDDQHALAAQLRTLLAPFDS